MVKSVKKPGQKSEKDPPIFSHEYLLRNQADLVSSACLIVMSGLLFKVFSDQDVIQITYLAQY